jgi:hypothetical protein
MTTHWAVLALVLAILLWRVSLLFGTPPQDRTRIEDHIRRRGDRLISIERDGGERILANSSLPPIRKYRIETENSAGFRESRVIGVEAPLFMEPKLWRYDQSGDRHPMF